MWEKTIVPVPDTSEEFRSSPEKRLIAAVLERAYWDLDYVQSRDMTVVRDAIRWFRDADSAAIPFRWVLDFLPIKPQELKALDTRVKEAEEFIVAADRKAHLLGKDEKKEFAAAHFHEVAVERLRAGLRIRGG